MFVKLLSELVNETDWRGWLGVGCMCFGKINAWVIESLEEERCVSVKSLCLTHSMSEREIRIAKINESLRQVVIKLLRPSQ